MPFKISKGRLEHLADKFQLEESSVDVMYNFFQDKVEPYLEEQYMSHFVRAVESLSRELLDGKGEDVGDGNRIIISKMDGDRGEGRVQYSKPRMNRSSRYVVSYYEKACFQTKRYVISHELGHILVTLAKYYNDNTDPNLITKKMTEPTCSLLGFFALASKSQFYQDVLDGNKNEQLVETDFDTLLNNFMKSIPNQSPS